MERFVFGVPLIGRAAAGDWALVSRLFGLMLASIRAQTDTAFELILATHDVPQAWSAVAGDPRFTLIEADWPVTTPSAANDDGGRKKWLIGEAVRARGGGLLMFVDGDDWIDRETVEAARVGIAPGMAGGVVADGIAVHWPTRTARRFPVPGLYDGPFAGLCGSSTVGRIDPSSADPVARDPHGMLGWHGDWVANAARAGVGLAMLPVTGAYLVGTGGSHSERDGPHAGWRRAFSDGVGATGVPLGDADLARFGLTGAQLA